MKRAPTRRRPGGRGQMVKLVSPQAKPATVRLLMQPPKIEKPKRIHPRHVLPLIPEGAERNVHSTTREMRFHAVPLATGEDLALALNTELTEPGGNRTASNVGEPSCATNGQAVLYTGNWYAAISSDG